jgi:hypothetical protein
VLRDLPKPEKGRLLRRQLRVDVPSDVAVSCPQPRLPPDSYDGSSRARMRRWMQPVTATVDRRAEDAAWSTAAEDVASALLASRVKNHVAGLRPPVDLVECTAVQCAVYRWIPEARSAWEASHPVHGGRCRCRQEAVAIVGASWESRLLGLDYTTLMRQTLKALDDYLDARS